MTVAELLQQSRAAHRRYRESAGHVKASGDVAIHPNDEAARLAVVDALRFRNEAHDLDPAMDDFAWADDLAANKGVSSERMREFFSSFFVTKPR